MNISRKKIILGLLPSLIIILTCYTFGITSNIISGGGYNAPENDSHAPGLHLVRISEGFMKFRGNLPVSHAILESIYYVPYIFLRTGELPPYNIPLLDQKNPTIIAELIVLVRLTHIVAAIGIVFFLFLSFLALTRHYWGSIFVALSVALNANLMFQSGVTYIEAYSLFWVCLSFLCFISSWRGENNSFLWFFMFFISAAFALSSHERMGGYYWITTPILLTRFIWLNKQKSISNILTLLQIIGSILTGILIFCLLNMIFFVGLNPFVDYLQKKGQCMILDRSSIWLFLRNQIGCHGHTVRLIFWDLGIWTAVLSLAGFWLCWKQKAWDRLILIVFLIGYQILSIGYPGWTCGRYALGQTIFFGFFAGFSIIHICNIFEKRKVCAVLIAAVCLLTQAVILISVKVADTYYHPARILETLSKDKNARCIVTKHFAPLPPNWCQAHNIKSVYEEGKAGLEQEIEFYVIDSEDCKYNDKKLKREIYRKPPLWLKDLVYKKIYLDSTGGARNIRIKYYN